MSLYYCIAMLFKQFTFHPKSNCLVLLVKSVQVIVTSCHHSVM